MTVLCHVCIRSKKYTGSTTCTDMPYACTRATARMHAHVLTCMPTALACLANGSWSWAQLHNKPYMFTWVDPRSLHLGPCKRLVHAHCIFWQFFLCGTQHIQLFFCLRGLILPNCHKNNAPRDRITCDKRNHRAMVCQSIRPRSCWSLDSGSMLWPASPPCPALMPTTAQHAKGNAGFAGATTTREKHCQKMWENFQIF